jgi:hypothetical protein
MSDKLTDSDAAAKAWQESRHTHADRVPFEDGFHLGLAFARRQVQAPTPAADAPDHGDDGKRGADREPGRETARAPDPGQLEELYPGRPLEWTVADLTAAFSGGVELRESEPIARMRREEHAWLARTLQSFAAVGVSPGEVEILSSWGDICESNGRLTITRSVQVRHVRAARQRHDPRELSIGYGYAGGTLDGIRAAAMGCNGVLRVDIEQTGPTSALLDVYGDVDLAEVRRAVDRARPGACDVKIRRVRV